MEGLGFPEKFIGWVMTCVKIVNYSIMLNGESMEHFNAARSLKQGDPISLFLFVIAMEYLSRLLNGLKEEKGYKFHPRCGKLGITHLSFADDLLLFARGDKNSIQKLQACFATFSEASGMKANMAKSIVYCGGINTKEKAEIIQLLGHSLGKLPFKYLGVPLDTKKLTVVQWQPLIGRIVSKITSWTTKKLSYARRIQLVQSVIFGMQSYWSQIFTLPVKVTKLIEAYCRSYMWSGRNEIT
nr:uncharacterized protein LOC104096290 [Nicotiana tomentosiformis]